LKIIIVYDVDVFKLMLVHCVKFGDLKLVYMNDLHPFNMNYYIYDSHHTTQGAHTSFTSYKLN